MNQRMKSALKVLAAACTMAAASAASAQSAGQWTVKAGLNKITPKVTSGDVSAPALPGSRSDVGSDTQPVLVFAYGLSDNVSTEMALGTPYKHEVYGAGAIAGTGKLGTVEALPPTVFIQYRFFQPETALRPYVGLGVTYTYFRKAQGSGQLTALLNTGGPAATFKVDNKVSGTVQAGLAYSFTAKWFIDATVNKSFLKTTTHYSTGQTQDIKLDPLAVTLAVGYKF